MRWGGRSMKPPAAEVRRGVRGGAAKENEAVLVWPGVAVVVRARVRAGSAASRRASRVAVGGRRGMGVGGGWLWWRERVGVRGGGVGMGGGEGGASRSVTVSDGASLAGGGSGVSAQPGISLPRRQRPPLSV